MSVSVSVAAADAAAPIAVSSPQGALPSPPAASVSASAAAAAAPTACRVVFNVAVHGMDAGEAVGVCVSAQPAAGAGSAAVFDPARAVLLTRVPTADGGEAESAGSAVTAWHTPRGVALTRGQAVRYAYGVWSLGANNGPATFLYWEQMRDSAEAPTAALAPPPGRPLVPGGKHMRLDDVFGEVRARACRRVPHLASSASLELAGCLLLPPHHPPPFRPRSLSAARRASSAAATGRDG